MLRNTYPIVSTLYILCLATSLSSSVYSSFSILITCTGLISPHIVVKPTMSEKKIVTVIFVMFTTEYTRDKRNGKKR